MFFVFYLYPFFLLPSHKTHTTLLVDISLVWMHSISCDFNDWLTLREILKCKMMKNCKKNYYTTKFWSLKEVKKTWKKISLCFEKALFWLFQTNIPTTVKAANFLKKIKCKDFMMKKKIKISSQVWVVTPKWTLVWHQNNFVFSYPPPLSHPTLKKLEKSTTI